MRFRILDAFGNVTYEGECEGELGRTFDANLPDSGNLILEYTPPGSGTSFEVDMKLLPFDRVDAQVMADVFDVPVEWLPFVLP